ncbi:hypothetical protein C8R43DRAFT_957026 [Mycena crocata]|nr:hypothetical protein C8R43DRAFT_957026 [Mycena crocata]
MASDSEVDDDDFQLWLMSIDNQPVFEYSEDEDPDADTRFLSLLAAVNNEASGLPNNGVFMPLTLIFTNRILARIIDFIATYCLDITLEQFLGTRSALRSSSRSVREAVDACPLFWRRAIFTPRQSLSFQVDALDRVDLSELDFTIRVASDVGLEEGDVENSLERYMMRTSALLHTYFPACIRLAVEAKTAGFLDIMLQFLLVIPHPSLQTFVVAFSFNRFATFEPSFISDFTFYNGRSFGFMPITILALCASSVVRSVASYSSASTLSASVQHPRSKPLPWSDFMGYISASTWLTRLRLDGIRCGSLPLDAVSTVLLPQLQELDVRFDGQRSLASFLRVLNVPGLLVFKFRAATSRDVACLLECGSIMVAITEFHIITRPDFRASVAAVFGWLHSVKVLDIRLSSSNVFGAFCSASFHPEPFSGEKWTCCGRLEHLLVCGVRMSQLRWIVEKRMYSGCCSLKKISVEQPGGYPRWDSFHPAHPSSAHFFRQLDIELSIVNT